LCRYELSQVLSGDRALSDVIKVLSTELLLLPAARALLRYDVLSRDEQARLALAFSSGIGEIFAQAGAPDAQVDLVVVNAEQGQAVRAIEAFGRDARVVIVASDGSKPLRAAYTEVRRLVELGLENFEVVVPVTVESADAGTAYANLAKTAKRFLDIDLADGGTVTVVPPPSRTAITFSSTRMHSASPFPLQSPTHEVPHAAIH
jgi:flagellar biosynthesis protein FlhG